MSRAGDDAERSDEKERRRHDRIGRALLYWPSLC